MKILLTGAAGQLGSELLPILSARGQVIPTDRSAPRSAIANWVTLDVGNGRELDKLLDDLQPELIVNTAAYTAVDQAESDSEIANAVNAELPGRLAGWAKQNTARLIHYSTDYVFDGTADKPYTETSQANPLSVYGASKLAGERVIQSSGCGHAVLRTSWVYSSHGKNFVLSMLDLARRGVSLNVVDDQLGCPTWARNLARTSDAVIGHWQDSTTDHHSGLFHYCDDQALSWYGFARAIFGIAVKTGLLENEPECAPIPSSGFPQPAERPKYSILNTSRIADVFGIQAASFETSLKTVVKGISTKGLA